MWADIFDVHLITGIFNSTLHIEFSLLFAKEGAAMGQKINADSHPETYTL